MPSETPIKLPLIDFSTLDKKENNEEHWNLTKSQVLHALEEFGCFEAIFTNIPLDLHTSMYDSLQLLFDLPLETKLKNQSPEPFHGYIGQNPSMPLYESMGIDEALIVENAESFTKVLWPEGNSNFCKTIQQFSEKLSKLDQMVRLMVLESLGWERYMDEHMGSTNYLFRFMNYKGPEENESNVALGSHTDKNMLTILHQYQVGGLEVQTKSGNWIKIQPSPNTFIVMIGESFRAWTNGRLYAPYHRVIMGQEKSRYSLALFSIKKPGYIVEAPKEVVDKESPLVLFKPYDEFQFDNFFETKAA